ncbi:MAG: twin transmembrane helix small protein [Betaproteobacteria bacterium]|nr:twin transmembrane helix small protein [Betaproteobacteria bacterium]
MDAMKILVILAVLAVIGSLAAGISSMVTGGEVAHRRSEQWMTWRVGLQAAAVVLLIIALFQ